MSSPYNPINWYWFVGGDLSVVYSSATPGFVPINDAAYLSWLDAGGIVTNIASMDELRDVLMSQFPAGWKKTVADVADDIKAKRDRLSLAGGVKVGNHWFLSTERATSEYNTILNTTRGVPDSTVVRAGWRTMDGAQVNMTPALALQILSAGIAQRCDIDDAAQVHLNALQGSPNPASYDFSGAWPATFEG